MNWLKNITFQIFENLNKDDLERVTSYAQSTGLILGALVGSMMADIFGRRRLLYVSLAGMLALHCLVALSISWIMFIFLRIITVGCAGTDVVVSLLIYIFVTWRKYNLRQIFLFVFLMAKKISGNEFKLVSLCGGRGRRKLDQWLKHHDPNSVLRLLGYIGARTEPPTFLWETSALTS